MSGYCLIAPGHPVHDYYHANEYGFPQRDEGELFERLVLNGGPVHPERGFVIHDDARAWDSSLIVGDGLYLTTSRDILEAMARGEGPANAVVTLGCAGWGAGQLESELSENSWLTVPADPAVMFDLPVEERFVAALKLLGIDPMMLTGEAGHA